MWQWILLYYANVHKYPNIFFLYWLTENISNIIADSTSTFVSLFLSLFLNCFLYIYWATVNTTYIEQFLKWSMLFAAAFWPVTTVLLPPSTLLK